MVHIGSLTQWKTQTIAYVYRPDDKLNTDSTNHGHWMFVVSLLHAKKISSDGGGLTIHTSNILMSISN